MHEGAHYSIEEMIYVTVSFYLVTGKDSYG